MYKIIMRLPFSIILVHRNEYTTKYLAQMVIDMLPGSFEVIHKNDLADETNDIILVPFKE